MTIEETIKKIFGILVRYDTRTYQAKHIKQILADFAASERKKQREVCFKNFVKLTDGLRSIYGHKINFQELDDAIYNAKVEK